MSDFNIKEVDFYNLDIEKYTDWLLDRYELFNTICQLPYLEELIIDLQKRNYFASSHYLFSRNKPLPKTIENLYRKKIQHFEKQTKKFENIYIELIFFKSVGYDREVKHQKYIFFSSEELKEIRIDTSWLKFWLLENKGAFDDLVNEVDKRKKSSPLKDIPFYQKEIEEILNSFDFVYLPNIMNGGFIYNLDNDSEALQFSTEVEKIKLLTYLREKIQGNNAVHPLTKPIQWNGKINALATLFKTFSDLGIIETTPANIKRLLLNNFVDEKKQDLSKNYLDEIFNTSKGKLNKQVVREITQIINVFEQNSPSD